MKDVEQSQNKEIGTTFLQMTHFTKRLQLGNLFYHYMCSLAGPAFLKTETSWRKEPVFSTNNPQPYPNPLNYIGTMAKDG